jgi:hypothetical protein
MLNLKSEFADLPNPGRRCTQIFEFKRLGQIVIGTLNQRGQAISNCSGVDRSGIDRLRLALPGVMEKWAGIQFHLSFIH